MAVKPKSPEIEITPPRTGTIRLALVGTSELVKNRVATKARRELLLPHGRRRSTADRAKGLKHVPLQEYRDSVYRLRAGKDGVEPITRLYFPGPGFKGTMATAALDLPGTKKAEIGRLVWVTNRYVPIFGVPKLYMAVVRNSDINHTPDIRTRAILERWACFLDVMFIMPNLTASGIANLLTMGGLTAGVGDGRQEKGKLSFGQFRITDQNDAEFRDILRTGHRAAQDAALEDPEFFDDDTEELYSWFNTELNARRSRGQTPEEDIDADEDDFEAEAKMLTSSDPHGDIPRADGAQP